jgi:hypothetical protein
MWTSRILCPVDNTGYMVIPQFCLLRDETGFCPFGAVKIEGKRWRPF